MKKRKTQRARVVVAVLLVVGACLSARRVALSMQAEVERLKVRIEYHFEEGNSERLWPFEPCDPWLK